MPREIIDTRTSRPAYIRRNVLVVTLVAVLVAIVLLYVYESRAASRRPVPESPGPAHRARIPGK